MKRSNSIYLIIMILTGTIIGNILGRALAGYLPILNYGESISFGPALLDLNVISLTIGFSANLTVSGIIGLVLAFILYKKL